MNATRFQFTMKHNHRLSIEYAARLLRVTVAANGPILHGHMSTSAEPGRGGGFSEAVVRGSNRRHVDGAARLAGQLMEGREAGFASGQEPSQRAGAPGHAGQADGDVTTARRVPS